ncbi:HDIG domain-containing metalloprotein [Acetivibrio mesophilus]|uniref:HDIG domain-containing protein n=1 Tax=Acetivibrio mesophilus TaxID=2487273 RepID=A0A4Q0I4G4_9FIRM|nr:HDIG domain-containing metalloprotein [Acetivibrio mesophilus]ODM26011.1 phosphohydrolase [Clostridium sp. Bc-iso-3]RXE59193.1 HDIG domain-containing protein [Acetivibrio mesophilus]HHV29205.1 HDIG domain-containing protein [Clostridium sp.]
MEREQALEELRGRIENENLIKHSLAVEAIMKDLAFYFKDDIDKWGLAGLLHDIDCEKTAGDISKHSLVGAEILESLDIESSIVYAVKAHNDYHGIERKRKIDKALFCADPAAGIITASALILPSKKLEDVTVEFVIKRINEKGFAKGVNREQIKSCEQLGISLEKFIEISLEAMKKISDDLGL